MNTDPSFPDSRPGVFQATRPIVLASASPRRRDLLASLGLDFAIDPARGEEPLPEPGEAPEAYAMRMARAKAGEVALRHPGTVVLGADTIVVLDGEGTEGREGNPAAPAILGKPADREDGLRMLRCLSGRVHRVVTGCCLILPDRPDSAILFRAVTKVAMPRLRDPAIQAYLATGEPDDKAGAYAIQGLGGFLVERIEGSYSNVVGLPLWEVLERLLALDIVRPVAPR
jgi:septum formation protein